MSTRRWFAVATFVAMAMANGPGAAHADDRRDCERFLFETRVQSCTRLAELPSLTKSERAEALANRGRAYLGRTGRERLAIADFEAARRLVEPNAPEASLYEGLAHLARRQNDAALKAFTEAIRLNPRLASALVARAAAHRFKGDLDAALRDLDAAVSIDDRIATAYSVRGSIYGQRKDLDRALADFDRALALDPTHSGVWRTRALAKSELGRFDEAIADYNEAIRLDPGVANAFNGRGYAFLKKGDLDRALADFDTAISLEPTLAVALANRAQVRIRRGDRPSAIADYERILTLPALSAEDRNRQQIARERIPRLRGELAGQPNTDKSSTHKRIALVIGNGRYANAPALINPVNDARAMADAFRRLGFTSVTEITNATRDQLAKALQNHGDQSASAEWSVVFFAGHGIEINGASYLIPVDASLKRDTHVDDEAISLARVMAKVDGASRIGLVILDSCRDNPFLPRMTRSAGATRSLSAGLAPVEPDGNVLVAYAARHGTVAEDGKGANSPFTEALLTHIEEPGLEVSLLFRKVRDAVRRKTDRRQDPFTYGTLGSDPLFLRSASAR